MLQLKKFPDIPVSTPEEARGSGHLQRSSVSASKLEMRDPSLLARERIPDVSDASQEEARCTVKARGTHGSCHHSKSPPDVSVHSRGSCFPCTASTFTPRIDSHHGGTWDSPVGKSGGKAIDPLIHAKGSVTLLLQHGRKAHVHAPTRDEASLPCGDSRSTPKSMSALERNPQVPAPSPHKVLGPGIDGRGTETGPLATRMGTGLS